MKKQVNKACAFTVRARIFLRFVETKTRFFDILRRKKLTKPCNLRYVQLDHFLFSLNGRGVFAFFTVPSTYFLCFVETKTRFLDVKMRESVYFTIFSVRPKYEISCFKVFLKLTRYPGGIQNSGKIRGLRICRFIVWILV